MSTEILVQTAEDLFEMPDDGFRYELVQGVLRRMSPAGGEHGEICSFLNGHLMLHVRQNRLGKTYAAETGFKIRSNPDTVLAPDVAFVTQDRVQTIGDRRKFVPFAPDLAIEILSPGDSERDSQHKVNEWLSSGTRAVVLVNPRMKTVTVHRSLEQRTVLTERDHLKIPDIVPGWSVAVSEIFESL